MQGLMKSGIAERFEVAHLDTSDHRGIANVGRVDLRNIGLALKHGAQFAWLLLRHRPRLVYLPVARNRVGFLRDALFLVPARLTRRRVVVHFHSWDFEEFRRRESGWIRALVGLAFGRSTHVIVLADSLRGAFGPLVQPERVHVVANGVRDSGVGLPAGQRPPTVLHLSTLWSEKGAFDVLELARRSRSKQSTARFVLAGPWYDDAERAEAEELVRREELDDLVELTGPVRGAAKDQLVRDASVVVLPSRWEGQPLVLLEAFAAGTPVVASRVGAVPDTVADGVEGFLVEPGNVAQLEDRVDKLLADPDLRSEFGEAARRRYERDYSVERFGVQMTELLVRIASDERQLVSGVESESRAPSV
jgi:glycosyltransferase involved in cell wall biosynthesis